MSRENAEKFFKKMETDKQIGKSVIEAIGKISKASSKEEALSIFETNVLAEAKKQGLDFTIDEIPQNLFGVQTAKLSIDQLSNVSGGVSFEDLKKMAEQVYSGGKKVTSDVWGWLSKEEHRKDISTVIKFMRDIAKQC